MTSQSQMNRPGASVQNYGLATGSSQLPDKLQNYLSTECQLPLSKYEDGGVFNSYILHSQLNQFATTDAERNNEKPQMSISPDKQEARVQSCKNGDLNVVQIEGCESLPSQTQTMIEEAQSAINRLRVTQTRPSTDMESFGKVHLTKRMIRDRELYLGVSSRQSKGAAGSKAKDQASLNISGNESLQQAWNTTGFLPTKINAAGQKNSVKDFEYLKFLNDTILKDDVLEKFMIKAGEIEEAAGPKSKSPKKKQMTPLEKIQSLQSDFKKNPTRFHGCKNLDLMLNDQPQQIKQSKRSNQAQNHARDKSLDDKESYKRNSVVSQKRSSLITHTQDSRSTERRKNGAHAFPQKCSLIKEASPRKTAKKKLEGVSASGHNRGASRCKNESNLKDFSPNQELSNAYKKSPIFTNSRIMLQEAYRKTSFMHKRTGAAQQSSLEAHLLSIAQQNAQPNSKPQTSAGVSRPRINTQESDCFVDLQNQSQFHEDPKRVSAEVSPRQYFYELQQKMNLNKKSACGNSIRLNTFEQEGDKPRYITKSRQGSQISSPRRTNSKSQSKRQKIISNITGQASDKLRLTTRLNEAVDDLIKMGQSYRQKSQMIANQIPESKQPSLGSQAETINVSRFSSVPDVLSFQQLTSKCTPKNDQPAADRFQNSNNMINILSNKLSPNVQTPKTVVSPQNAGQQSGAFQLYCQSDENQNSHLDKRPSQARLRSRLASPQQQESRERIKLQDKLIDERHVLAKSRERLRNTGGVYVSFDMVSSREKVKQQLKEKIQKRSSKKGLEPILVSNSSSNKKLQKNQWDDGGLSRTKTSKWEHQKVIQSRKLDSATQSSQSHESLPSLTKAGKKSDRKAADHILVEDATPLRKSLCDNREEESRIMDRQSVGRRASLHSRYEMDRLPRKSSQVSSQQNRASLQSRGNSDKFKEVCRNHVSKSVNQQVLAYQQRRINRLSKLHQPNLQQPILQQARSKEEIPVSGQTGDKTAPHSNLVSLTQLDKRTSNKPSLQPLDKETSTRAKAEQICKNKADKSLKDEKTSKQTPQLTKLEPTSSIIAQSSTPQESSSNAQAKQPPSKTPKKPLSYMGKQEQDQLCLDHVVTRIRHRKQQQRSIDGKPIAKDDAIEMIQTGPPEMFSSILRSYLCSQQRHNSVINALPEKIMPEAQQKKELEKIYSSKRDSIVPETHFSKMQQKLLAGNVSSKQSIFSQSSNRRITIPQNQSTNATTSKRRSVIRGTQAPPASSKISAVYRTGNNFDQKAQSLKEQFLVPKLRPYRHTSQQSQQISQIKSQATSEASMSKPVISMQPEVLNSDTSGHLEAMKKNSQRYEQFNERSENMFEGNRPSQKIIKNEKNGEDVMKTMLSEHYNRRIFRMKEAYARAANNASAKIQPQLRGAKIIVQSQDPRQKHSASLIEKDIGLQSSTNSSKVINEDGGVGRNQVTKRHSQKVSQPPEFSFRGTKPDIDPSLSIQGAEVTLRQQFKTGQRTRSKEPGTAKISSHKRISLPYKAVIIEKSAKKKSSAFQTQAETESCYKSSNTKVDNRRDSNAIKSSHETIRANQSQNQVFSRNQKRVQTQMLPSKFETSVTNQAKVKGSGPFSEKSSKTIQPNTLEGACSQIDLSNIERQRQIQGTTLNNASDTDKLITDRTPVSPSQFTNMTQERTNIFICDEKSAMKSTPKHRSQTVQHSSQTPKYSSQTPNRPQHDDDSCQKAVKEDLSTKNREDSRRNDHSDNSRFSDLKEPAERPRLQRPAFLQDAQSMRILLKQQLGSEAALALEIINRTAKTGAASTPYEPGGPSRFNAANITALRNRFNPEIKTQIQASVSQTRSPERPSSTEITIEQQLQQSSIMAMQGEGLEDGEVSDRRTSIVSTGAQQPQINFNQYFNFGSARPKRASGGGSN